MQTIPASPLEAFANALDPAGPAAASIAGMYWVMVWIFGAVFVVVIALSWLAIRKRRALATPSPPMGDTAFIIVGGFLVPAVILLFILVYTLLVQRSLAGPDDALTIEVTGHMWWWEVRYPQTNIVTANEIYIPVDETVRLVLRSNDVIHSLWVPSLAGKLDLIPGVTNELWINADRPGTYRGQCAEYCGLQHARMGMLVVALPKPEFTAWLKTRKSALTRLHDPKLKGGYEAFLKVGCAECHTIHGTTAQGKIGPDLTHIASRLTIGAGTIANNHGNLAGWVAQPQALKPGNLMPAAYIEPAEFKALIEYLMTLK